MNLISELPDDLLVSILSRLTMREAAKTSVLSNRWRYLWKYIPVLSFDASTICDDKDEESMEIPKSKYVKWVGKDFISKRSKLEESKYIHWVDKVVNSHKTLTIDEFRVMFDFSEGCLEKLDSWLRFAMEKRVKRLELGIPMCTVPYCYNFPSLFLCKTLTSLELECVNVTDKALEEILIGCPSLELVSVLDSNTLVDLRVVGNLKTLIIKFCFMLTNLEISAPNLRSFEYSGPVLSSPFRSCRKLVEISIGSFYGDHLISDCSSLSSISSQLEVLSIKPSCPNEHIAKVMPVFPRVKTLHVMVTCLGTEKQLFSLRLLMNACPILETFVLEIFICSRGAAIENNTKQENETFPHKELKIVEIVGFCGHEVDFEFAKYLIDNIVSLEKLIIDPVKVEHKWETLEERTAIARNQAEQLRSYLRPGMELEIH